MLKSRVSLAVLVMCLLAASGGRGGAMPSSPYFPERGTGAIHQRALDLGGNATVLIVALQPGYEDFSLLTYLRTALGARVAVSYATNGEATPSDLGGRTPVEVAAQRKEEAVAAARIMDVSVHFLNLSDPGVPGSLQALKEAWNLDTVRVRLQRDLFYYRPHIVLVEGDMRGDSVQSMRSQLLLKLVREAIADGGKPGRRSANEQPLSVSRVYTEMAWDKKSFREQSYDRTHPVWGISYRSMSRAAADEYRSLRLQLGAWMQHGDRRYRPVQSGKAERPETIVAGLPRIGVPISSLGNAIRNLSAKSKGQIRTPELSAVNRAIDSLDRRLALGKGSLAESDFRLLIAWKNELENLRCSLLDVDITCTASDSLLAERQLFFLNFEGHLSGFSQGQTKIYFPGAIDHTWGVNESLGHQFDFQPPQQFRVLTPEHMDYSYPVAQFGIKRTTLYTRCSFIIVHNDSVPGRRFIYKGDVLIHAAPKRTFEILTPEVRAIDGAPVICKLVDISRDQFHGSLTMSGSGVDSVKKPVALLGKDYTLVDTLRLSLKGSLPAGDYPISVSLPGDVAAQFVARSFDLRVDTSARVALFTAFDESPVAHALDRMGIRWSRESASPGTAPDLAAASVAIIDRDALADLGHQSAVVERILEFVRAGGHLVVLPQSNVSKGGDGIIPGVAFRGSPLLPPAAALRTDSLHSFMTPNVLSKDDWEGWYVARSLCSVSVPSGHPVETQVASAKGNVPLLATFPEGKGRVTVVALDLISQLMRLHPGAYRIFANIMRKSE